MPHQYNPNDPFSYGQGHTIKEMIQIDKAKNVTSDQTDNFINQQNKLNMGASDTNVLTDFSSMGALGQYMKPAMAIMDNVYKIDEPTQREKDINLGRMALKFFTDMSVAASKPGATVLSSGVTAGAISCRRLFKQSLNQRAS